MCRLVFFLLAFAFFVPAFPVQSGLPEVQTYDQLVHAIRETRTASQARITVAVEQEKVREAWETGKLIDEHILLNKERAKYGEQVLQRLSFDLDTSQTELSLMLQFARAYPIYSPGNKLSWSHYRSLLAVNDPAEREALTRKAEEEGWTRDQVREEVRRRRSRAEGPVELPEITPGPLYTYQIIQLRDRLKIDLGFGIYHDLSEKEAKKFKEGDIVQLNVEAGLRARPSQGNHRGLPLQKLPDATSDDLFTYSATVTQVVDGDTFHALIDLGFGITLAQRVRLRRIDAPEILTTDGKEARAHLEKILFRDKGRILMKSTDLDQHGRPIADVWVQGKSIDQEMLDKDLAVGINE